jgi:hypothetical protein
MAVITTIGTMAASVGGIQRDGEIRTEGRGFIAIVDGFRVGQAGSLEGAAHQLAEELRRKLPRQDGSWGVSVSCSEGGRGLAFGDMVGGGGGGGTPDPCVTRVLNRFNGGENNLHRALECAADFLAKCCG